MAGIAAAVQEDAVNDCEAARKDQKILEMEKLLDEIGRNAARLD